MNFILQISSNCGQGGEGVKKSENFGDIINGCSQYGNEALNYAAPFADCQESGGTESREKNLDNPEGEDRGDPSP